ncbi:putative AP endonuclease 2 [Rosellinia necatrix]|uniref:DNA-(apurinic or apyrimidinic site) endonuclease 2 n=1 Tax=Rosellinia necatrix TaxID=77044 RepID=A0A1W2TUZ1_ROSNE|nr:putative AP endonuclease 2 [Rosellinia necatrix]
MALRLTSWNVNGIRNPFGYQPWTEKKTFEAMFDILEADIVVMQETKIQRKDLRDDMVLVPGWDVFFSLPRHKKGYAGVAIYTRNSACAPIRAEEGIVGALCPPNSTIQFKDLPKDQQIGGYPRPGQLQLNGGIDELTLDSEGRCVILEFPAFVLIGTYSPANRDESRDDFRHGYMRALDVRVRNLVAMGKRVIVTGDLNVVRDIMDTANLPERLRKEGMTTAGFFATPSRRVFNQLLFEGNVIGLRDKGRENPVLWDLCRLFHPKREGMFTCWDTKKNTRPANFGSRIDYVLCSDAMKSWFADSNIQEGLMGSDHCPVFATFNDTVKVDGEDVHIKDVMNPPGMFKNGERLREWSTKDLLSLSAKLIPEFDRRRNIKDMFFKKPTTTKAAFTLSQEVAASQSDELGKSVPSGSLVDSRHPPSTVPVSSPAKSLPASLKRTPSIPASSSKPPKKARAGPSREPSIKGQSNLMGFFKSKATENGTPQSERGPPFAGGLDGTVEAESSYTPTKSDTPKTDTDEARDESAFDSAETVFDPIQNKESWSKLLGKRVVPKCEHGQDCISLVTKKSGMNRGRSFFICPRPLGPSGEKEKGTEWRCGTFIWSSEWKPTNTS